MNATPTSWTRKIPLMLIYSRMVFGGLLLIFSVFPTPYYTPVAFTLISAALLSDILDGIIARRLKISTEGLRRMDSSADQLFWVLAVIATFIQCRDFFYNHYASLGLLILLEVMTYIICFLKFKKEVATHAVTSKIWTLILFGLMIQLTMTCDSVVLFQICLYAGIISRLEIIAILISLKEWTHDVPSIYHALLLRKGKPITRHKLFNG